MGTTAASPRMAETPRGAATLRGPVGETMSGKLVRRYSDIALAAMVVGIIAMMIIPLPTHLLDILLAMNICLGVVVLLAAIYVTDPIRISTFPTLLLIATLFRLGLNVSSTRLILLQADAGEVIRSFGHFVVAGNLVVGIIVFLILTLIQFIVIAKGAERVAEVGARFNLDAMPGKQMSIDADLRAGTIDQQEARTRRRALERESQLYGSMDGAMKFVKGDAIAGIVITLINIVGGLLVGVYQMKMSTGEAAEVYSLLTVGDGLVSQIPALVLSTAAGLVVTRVAAEEGGTHLGQDIATQLLAQPRALAIAAVLMLGLAAVPGLPGFPFLVLGGLCGVTAHGLIRRRREEAGPASKRGGLLEAFTFDPEPDEADEPEARFLVDPVRLELGAGFAGRAMEPEETGASSGVPSWDAPGFVEGGLGDVRRRIFQLLGVSIPPVRVREDVDALEERCYRIRIKEVPMGEGEAPEDSLLALASVDQLSSRDISAQAAELTGLEARASWIDPEDAPRVEAAGLTVLSAAEIPLAHLEALLQRYAYEFVDIQATRTLLDALEETSPQVVQELVPKPVSVVLLTEVLTRLVEEQVNIRHLADVLPTLARWCRTEKDPVLLTEYCRMALRRPITYQFAGPEGRLAALTLEPEIEETVVEAIQRSDAGSYLALEPEVGREILEAVDHAVAPFRLSGSVPVLLTRMESRRFVRKLIEVDLPDVVVLSYQELAPDLEIQPLGQVCIGLSA